MDTQISIPRSGLRSLFAGLLPLFVFAHFGHHLLTALPMPLIPMIRSDLSLDYAQSGWVISAFTLCYGLGQLPGGWLADRMGPRLMITIGICGLGLAGLGVGFSPGYSSMIFFLALMGMLGGGYHPSAPPMISASVEPKHQGRALGVHLMGGSASYFLAPLIATGIAAFWNWRGSFIVLAILAILFGIFFNMVLGRIELRRPPHASVSPKGRADEPSARRVRPLVTFIALSNLLGATVTSSMAFIPLLLVDRFGYSKENAGALFAFIYSAGLWISPLAGYLSDRFGRIPLMIGISFASAPVIYLLNHISSFGGIVVLLLLIGVVIYVRMPVSESYIIRHTSERNRSMVLGVYMFGSMEGGGVLTPVMGYMIDHLGFYASYTVAGVFIIGFTLICWMLLRGSKD
jgi:MFS family permease